MLFIVLIANQMASTLIFGMEFEGAKSSQTQGIELAIREIEEKEMMPNELKKPSKAIEKTINTLMEAFNRFEIERSQKSEHWEELGDLVPSDIFERHNFDVIVDKIENFIKYTIKLNGEGKWGELTENTVFKELNAEIGELPSLEKLKKEKLDKLTKTKSSTGIEAVKNIWHSMDAFVKEIRINLAEFIDFPLRMGLATILAPWRDEFWRMNKEIEKREEKIVVEEFGKMMELIERNANVLRFQIEAIRGNNAGRLFLENVPENYKKYAKQIDENIVDEIFNRALPIGVLDEMNEEVKLLNAQMLTLVGALEKQSLGKKGKGQITKGEQKAKKELRIKEGIKADLVELRKIYIGVGECVKNIQKEVDDELRENAEAFKKKMKNYERLQKEYFLTRSAAILSTNLVEMAKKYGFSPIKFPDDNFGEASIKLFTLNLLTMNLGEKEGAKYGEFSIHHWLGELKKMEYWPNGAEEKKMEKGIEQLLKAFETANAQWGLKKEWENEGETFKQQTRSMLTTEYPKEGRIILALDPQRDLAKMLYEMYKKTKEMGILKEGTKGRKIETAMAGRSNRKQKEAILG